MSENNRIEFKKQLTDHIDKEVVAFLNYIGGGVIYIGIDDKGFITGIDNADQVQLIIKDRIKNNISPSCMGLFDVVEEFGSGVPRILQSYDEDCFYFSDKYIRMRFPKENVTEQVTEQVEMLLLALQDEMTLNELMIKCKIKHRPSFLYNYIKPALEQGFIEMTIPNKPNSKNQKYRMSNVGLNYIQNQIKVVKSEKRKPDTQQVWT